MRNASEPLVYRRDNSVALPQLLLNVWTLRKLPRTGYAKLVSNSRDLVIVMGIAKTATIPYSMSCRRLQTETAKWKNDAC